MDIEISNLAGMFIPGSPSSWMILEMGTVRSRGPLKFLRAPIIFLERLKLHCQILFIGRPCEVLAYGRPPLKGAWSGSGFWAPVISAENRVVKLCVQVGYVKS